LTHQFLPYLTDEQGRSLDVDNGVVVTSGLIKPLDDSPDGWEKTVVQFARNNEFRGIVKSYTTPLRFFFEGAKILKTWFYGKGIEAVMFFIWTKLDQNFGGGMIHKGWYKGEVDFSTFRQEWAGVTVTINEGGLFKQLTANKTIPYEVPFDDDTVSVVMDGVLIQNTAKYSVIEAPYNADLVADFLPAVPIVQEEGVNFSLQINGQTLEVGLPSPTLPEFNYLLSQGTNNLFRNILGGPLLVQNQVANIAGSVTFKATAINNTTTNRLLMAYRSSYGRVVNLFNQGCGLGTEYTYDISTSINCFPGEVWVLWARMIVGSGDPALFELTFVGDNYLTMSWESKFHTTVIDAHTVFNAGNKIIDQLSEGTSVLKSDLLNSDAHTLVTSGDAIRGIQGAVIKTKFSDYHKSVDALKCISFGVEDNNGRLESRAYGYDKNTEIANLGEASNVKIEPFNENIYDEIKSGYPTTDIDKVNGKYSFHNIISYKIPRTRRKNPYDCSSIYKACPYLIESIRINLEGKKTTDNSNDNDCFFLDCVKAFIDYSNTATFESSTKTITIIGTELTLYPNTRFHSSIGTNIGYFTIETSNIVSGNTVLTVRQDISDAVAESVSFEFRIYTLRRNTYTFTGVPTPTIFNVEISPKRNLINHYGWLAGSCMFLETKKISFQVTEKNKDFSTTDGSGNVITECEDIKINSLGPRMYTYNKISFNVKSPHNLYELMTSSGSRGYFTFTDKGHVLKGFTDDIKTNDATLETQEYVLLGHPDNDLTYNINAG
jgi:hypothetical protein